MVDARLDVPGGTALAPTPGVFRIKRILPVQNDATFPEPGCGCIRRSRGHVSVHRPCVSGHRLPARPLRDSLTDLRVLYEESNFLIRLAQCFSWGVECPCVTRDTCPPFLGIATLPRGRPKEQCCLPGQ